MSSPYKAAVIGGGMIGALMDDHAHSDAPQTHAGGFYNHKNFELVGICDAKPDEKLGMWGCAIYDDLDALFRAQKPDVLSVAVPEAFQFEVMKDILRYQGVKAVIAEKPLATDVHKAREIVKAFEAAGVPLLVNYTRRYSPMFQALAKRFQNGDEKVVSATIHYAKGLWHNGSHALDLARFLFGAHQEAKALDKIYDFYDSDPSRSAFLKFEYCPQFFLQALDERCYTLFEIDIFTEQARYIIHNDHRDMHVYEKRDHVGIPMGQRLVSLGVQKTDYEFCMSNLIENLNQVLSASTEPLCSGRTALQSLELTHDLVTQS